MLDEISKAESNQGSKAPKDDEDDDKNDNKEK
jgi:hypothetical protein